jgi:hypothetical protein
MKSKYLIVEHFGIELPIIFNPILDHVAVATAFVKICSAGFCVQDLDGKYTVWGKSVGLKISSRPGDEKILNENLEANV